MASLKKKTNAPHKTKENGTNKHFEEDMDESDTTESDVSSDEEPMEPQEKIDVEFEARNPEEFDFHGIRQLLIQLLLKSNIDVSEMTDMLLNSSVGSVIKQYIGSEDEDEEDDLTDDANQVYGVISCINITENRSKTSIHQLIAYISKRLSEDNNTAAKFQEILDNPSNTVGFIINERFVNIPAQIAVPSFDCLCHEMEEATKKGENYQFTHYLMVAKKFRMKTGKQGKKRRNRPALEPVVYTNGEEEFFSESSVFTGTYSVAGERDTGSAEQWDSELQDQYEPLREVMVIKATQLPAIMTRVKEALQQATQNT